MRKGTFQPNTRRKNKKQGFRARMKTGGKVIKQRRDKGRTKLTTN